MKLTQKQLTDLLQAAGVQHVEVVEDEANSDFSLDDALLAIDSAREHVIRPKIEQDVYDTRISKEIGKLHGTVNSLLVKHTGASRSQLDKINGLDERFDAAYKHREAQTQGSQDEINAKFEEMLRNHEQEKQTITQQYESQLNEARNKYVQRDIQSNLATILNSAPLRDGVDRIIAANDFQKHLAEKYDLTYDEAGKKIQLLEKGGNTIALNEGKTQAIDIMSEAKNYFTPRALWQEDMRGKNPKQEMEKLQQPKPYEERRQQWEQPQDPTKKFVSDMDSYLAQKTGS